MKKFLYILTALLFGAVSCSVDGPTAPEVDDNDGKVDFIMKVTLPEPLEVTKGDMDDQPVIDNLYIAVFGGEGYLNDYTRAVRCDENGENLIQNWSGIKNGIDFYFKVTLTATQSLRHVHVIANGPEQLDFNTYENELMLHLLTEGPKGAYWQYFELPNGTVQADGTTPSEEAAAAFKSIKLIRNFAKVSVSVAESVKNFQLTGFKVFNQAQGGSVAIWDGTKYMSDYATYSTVGDLQNVYPNGFVPEGVTYDTTKPAAGNDYDSNPKYVYERPGGQENGPYIIIKGKFGVPGVDEDDKPITVFDDDDTYYRLDFVNRDGDYLPLYRNFEYKIVLTSVAKRGPTSPVDLKASNSNVSSLTETENLSDIADGVSRLYVMWLDRTYMEGQNNVAFKYMYLKDAEHNTESSPATISILSHGDGGAAITAGDGWDGTGLTPGSDGWMTVTYNVQAPNTGTGAKEKTTTFRVTGVTDDGQKLYRNITIHVLPPQNFGTATVNSEGSNVGDKVTVSIPINSGLPSSIFPLEILFEDSNRNLNPYGTDMPTNIGPSITGGTGTSYQFKANLSWTEYSESTNNIFSFEFKRIKEGGTTLYYADTKNYFNRVNNSVTIPR